MPQLASPPRVEDARWSMVFIMEWAETTSVAGTSSQTEFERKPLQEVQRCVNVLIALEKRLAIDGPATDQDLRACCAIAAEDVDHPGKNATFAEALTAGKPNGEDDSPSVPF